MHLLMPKNIRLKKPQKPAVKPFRRCNKWKFRGFAPRGDKPVFGKYALQVKEEAWINSRTIEAVRRSIVRQMERKGKVWVRVFPHAGITERGKETRMGAGKGTISYWCAPVRPNFILFEMDGVTYDIAKLAMVRAMHKLPCKCKFIVKTDGPSRFELGLAGQAGRRQTNFVPTVRVEKKGKKK